jgi:hypothetical protein
MTLEEAKKSVAELRSQGADDEMALATFFTMFKDGKIDYEQFEIFAALVGYELTDEFKNLSDDERKSLDIFGGPDDEDYEDDEDIEEEDEEDDDEDNFKIEGYEPIDFSVSEEEKEEEKAMKLFGR